MTFVYVYQLVVCFGADQVFPASSVTGVEVGAWVVVLPVVVGVGCDHCETIVMFSQLSPSVIRARQSSICIVQLVRDSFLMIGLTGLEIPHSFFTSLVRAFM